MTNKQSRTFKGKVFQNAARASVAMKSKTGKSTGAGLRKEFPKSEKTLTTDSSKGSKTATGLKDNNSETEEPKHERDASPEPREDHLQSTKNTQDVDSTGFYSSCTDTALSSEKNVMDVCRSSKSKSSQEYMKKSWNNPNLRVPKMSKSSTTDRGSLSLKSFHQTALEACQPSSSDLTEPGTLNKPTVTKPCEILHPSEHQNNQLTTEQTRTSEGSKVSNSGSEMTRTNTSLSINPSGTHTSDFKEASPAHSTMTLPKGISPSNDTTCAPDKPSKDLPEDKDLVEVLIETDKNQLGSFKTVFHKYFKTSPAKRAAGDHMPISINQDPEPSEFCSVHQQSTSKSKIASETRTPSNPTLSEIPKANTAILKTLKISDKENREDLTLSVSVSATTRSSGNETSKLSGITSNTEKQKSNKVQSDVKSFRVPHSKSMIGQSQAKLWSFGNNTSTATVKTRKKSDNERNDSVSTISESTSDPSTSTPDQRASKRSFILHYMDTADILHSSPPPPSSTPLLLPPSSTTRLSLGTAFHDGNPRLRY